MFVLADISLIVRNLTPSCAVEHHLKITAVVQKVYSVP